eukprot:TRINITY_DN7223_c0_g4_i1.p1 TRINITY_DN7223_c0_g4~~TRINITY_DN7223_c0_g4_i1.p1  ORF type:complete len:476 (+),score=78.21 TRINITY_DN7223_c0_g4_i1:93-1430(+)
MPRVLWGVECLSLPGPTTPDAVVREFREALSLESVHTSLAPAPKAARAGTYGSSSSSRSSSNSSISSSSSSGSSCGKGKSTNKGRKGALPRVELYRLVPITEKTACVISGEDRVVAHLPDSNLSCSDLEEQRHQLKLQQQEALKKRDDADVRYDRVRESLIAMMDSFEGGEGQIFQFLRQENKALRNRLHQSELLRRDLQETARLLQSELSCLAREVGPLCSLSQDARLKGVRAVRDEGGPATSVKRCAAPIGPPTNTQEAFEFNGGGVGMAANVAPLAAKDLRSTCDGVGVTAVGLSTGSSKHDVSVGTLPAAAMAGNPTATLSYTTQEKLAANRTTAGRGASGIAAPPHGGGSGGAGGTIVPPLTGLANLSALGTSAASARTPRNGGTALKVNESADGGRITAQVLGGTVSWPPLPPAGARQDATRAPASARQTTTLKPNIAG